jgi:hypothetical protein
MAELTVREMSITELRSRVEEAERILRLARQLAQNELRDPASCERAKDRIAALCEDVNALFPGLGDAGLDAVILSEAKDPTPAVGSFGLRPQDDGNVEDELEGEEEQEGEDDEEEWDVDYEKLRASLGNPVLMGQFPDGGAQFRQLAEKLLEAHDRHALYARISDGFAELEAVTRQGAEQVRQQLAVALTLEELKNKRLD